MGRKFGYAAVLATLSETAHEHRQHHQPAWMLTLATAVRGEEDHLCSVSIFHARSVAALRCG
jgi:hypothetical protein